MRYVVAALVLGIYTVGPKAFGEELRVFANFDAKIAALENYTIEFVEPGKAAPSKKTRIRQGDDASVDGLKVRLIPAKKKS
ncbi:MAG: hypothetical protein AB7G93_18160 [Bdellovibrionales bacterium]